jgi:hypothetical protein
MSGPAGVFIELWYACADGDVVLRPLVKRRLRQLRKSMACAAAGVRWRRYCSSQRSRRFARRTAPLARDPRRLRHGQAVSVADSRHAGFRLSAR